MIEGDNEYVCGLLNGNYRPAEMFFYNCMEVSRDLLNGSFLANGFLGNLIQYVTVLLG